MEPEMSHDQHPKPPERAEHKGPSLIDRPLSHEQVTIGHLGNHKPKRKWWPPHFRMPRTKKEWIITISVILLLIGAGVAAYYIWFKPAPKQPAPTKKEEPKPKPVPLTSNLTGVVISDASINERPVTGIMIENLPVARPQSGINYAGVIFEAVAEGGITRFLTLYLEGEPDYIGPVRSIRPYYLQWLLGFDAPIAHVGGSGDALRLVKELNIKDLDQFQNSGAYHRISSRSAPHNMYTSMASLRAVEASKGYGKSNFTSIARKAEAPSATPNATSIDISVSSAAYNPHYDYDPATNSYKRFQSGAPHVVVDQSGQQAQLTPKVVVVLAMPKGQDGIYTTYQAVGGGDAMIYQDGVATPAIWHKNTNTSQITFTDANNQPIALNPGQTWFTAVGTITDTSYR